MNSVQCGVYTILPGTNSGRYCRLHQLPPAHVTASDRNPSFFIIVHGLPDQNVAARHATHHQEIAPSEHTARPLLFVQIMHLLLLLAGIALLRCPSALAAEPNSHVHILFLTDCTMYSDWQSVAMVFSFSRSHQAGAVTRVMCCTDEEKVGSCSQLLLDAAHHIEVYSLQSAASPA